MRWTAGSGVSVITDFPWQSVKPTVTGRVTALDANLSSGGNRSFNGGRFSGTGQARSHSDESRSRDSLSGLHGKVCHALTATRRCLHYDTRRMTSSG